MKKALSILLAFTLLLALAVPALASDGKPERGTMRFTEVIAPQYEQVRQFAKNGLAAAKKDGKWGYIDTTGAVVIPFQYNYAFSFSEGKALVSLGESKTGSDWRTGEEIGTWPMGLIDEKGTYTPLTYPEGWQETEDVPIYVNETQLASYDSYDHYVWNGYISVGANLYDAQGNYLMSNMNGNDFWQVTEGLVVSQDLDFFYYDPAKVKETGNSGYGATAMVKFLDAVGNMEPGSSVYRGARPFNQGLAPVAKATYLGYDETTGQLRMSTPLWGFMDREFRFVIEPQFEDYWVNDNTGKYAVFGVTGLASVKKDGKWGAIDKTGKTVIPFEYDHLQIVRDGLICFEKNGKYGYLDATTYQVAIPAQFVAATNFTDGLAPVYDGSKAYLIGKDGAKVPGSESLDARTYFPYLDNPDLGDLRYAVDEYAVIEKGGKYGFGHIEYDPPLPEAKEMDGWAYDEVTSAIEADLVPASLQNLYRQNITRQEFCSLIVELLKVVEGKTLEELVQAKTGKSLSAWQQEYPYYDAADREVIAASALGIINGRGNGVFDPYASINRQEAAAMLMRAAKLLALTPGQAISFQDTTSLPVWAKDGVSYVSGLTDPTTGKKVMGGTGNNEFSPAATYTREQAYLTMLRLHNCAEG